MRNKRFILLCLVLAAAFFLLWRQENNKRRFDSLESLKTFMWENGHWAVPKPPRQDWLPGTILKIESGVVAGVFLNHDSVLSTDYVRTTSSPLPEAEIQLKSSDEGEARFLSGRAWGKLQSQEGLKFRFRASGVKELYVEEPIWRSAITNKNDIRTELTSQSSQLVIITDCLVADDVEIELTTGSEALNKEAMKLGSTNIVALLAANYGGTVTNRSITRYHASGPIVIGYKATMITVSATSMGAAGTISFNVLSRAELEKIGQLDQPNKPGAWLRKSHVHLLTIGLDQYPAANQGEIGGELAAGPYSAQLVAREFADLQGGDKFSSIQVFAPTLELGRIRKKVSAGDVEHCIEKWRDEQNQSILQRKTYVHDHESDVFILYICAHGISSSWDRSPVILAEDYVDPPDKRSRPPLTNTINLNSVAWMLDSLVLSHGPVVVFADMCRKEDSYFTNVLAKERLPFHSKIEGYFMTYNRNEQYFRFMNTFCLFATPYDNQAFAVRREIDGQIREIGPLASLLSLFALTVPSLTNSLTLAQLIAFTTRGIDVNGVTLKADIVPRISDYAMFTNMASTLLYSPRPSSLNGPDLPPRAKNLKG